jgi:hypothetical protein
MTQLRPVISGYLSPAEYRAILGAASSKGHAWFCEALGWEIDDYSRQKYRDFQALGVAVTLFAPETIRALIDAFVAEQAER